METLVINLQNPQQNNRVIFNGLIYEISRGMINYRLLTYADVVQLSSPEQVHVFAEACPVEFHH